MLDSKLFVVFSALLAKLLYPLPLACLLLGAALLRPRASRLYRSVLGVALALLWLGGTRAVSEPLGRSLEWRYLPPSPMPSAERIVVLGGGTVPLVAPRAAVGLADAADRLLYAARLWRAGRAPVVVACGGHVSSAPGRGADAADMAEVLELMGVPATAIVQEARSRNTYENAVEARRLLAPEGVHRILLVTSALHMPRAVGLFRHQGFEVIPAPADFHLVDRHAGGQIPLPTEIVTWLVPDAETLTYTTRALHEYLGIVAYKAMGRLD